MCIYIYTQIYTYVYKGGYNPNIRNKTLWRFNGFNPIISTLPKGFEPYICKIYLFKVQNIHPNNIQSHVFRGWHEDTDENMSGKIIEQNGRF